MFNLREITNLIRRSTAAHRQYWIGGAVVAVACLALLIGGPVRQRISSHVTSSDPQITQTLTNIEFDKPFWAQFLTNQTVDENGQPTPGDSANLMALGVASGTINIMANAESAPWWKYLGGNANGVFTEFAVGKRSITEVSNQRSWSTDGVAFQSATIRYKIDFQPFLSKVSNLPNIEGTLTLVIRQNRANGEWSLYEAPSEGTTWSQDDQKTVTQVLAAVGQGLVGQLNEKIANARQEAYGQIEKNLANSGTLARDPANEHVLISTKAGLKFYFGDVFSLAKPSTLGGLKRYCAAKGPAGAVWRVPSLDELGRVFVQPENSGGIATLIDTPDSRLWQKFGLRSRPEFTQLIILTTTNSVVANFTATDRQYDIEAYQQTFGGSNPYKNSFARRRVPVVGPNVDDIQIGAEHGNGSLLAAVCVADVAPQQSTTEGNPGAACQRVLANLTSLEIIPRNSTLVRPDAVQTSPDHVLCTATDGQRTYSLVAHIKCQEFSQPKCAQATKVMNDQGVVLLNMLD